MNLSRIFSTACLALWCASFAAAQDDRSVTTPTGTYWNTGRTPAQLSQLAQDGWRFTDLERESILTGTYTVAAVRNTGSYNKNWWWYDNVTPSVLSRSLVRNNARLIDLEVWELGGEVRMSGIAIQNSGADATGWWWLYDQTASQLNTFISQNNARLLQLERYTRGGSTRFAAVMVPNTGSNQRPWGYFYGATLQQLTAYLIQQNMRIYDVERVGSNSYDAVVVREPVNRWWRYYGVSAGEVTRRLRQNQARLIDIERNGSSFDCVMVDNANDLERRARDILLNGTDGDSGVYLKEIGGPVLAAINPQFVFEPASLMKTLYLVHAMNEVRLGRASLFQNIPVRLGMTGSCPTNSGTVQFQTLRDVLRSMMEQSDNARTLAIAERFGVGNINTTATFLGMSRTSVNHVIGCGGPIPNELTLEDLGELHEDVALGGLNVLREDLYELMPNNLRFPTWGPRDLQDLISTEAQRLGLAPAVEDDFKDRMLMAYKPGGYTYNGRQYHSEGGFLRVPFKTSLGTITNREYTFGAFNHDATDLNRSRNQMCDAALEVVWDRVRAALQSWEVNGASASSTPFGQNCASSAGPMQHTAGLPRSGTTTQLRLSGAPRNAPAVTLVGFSRTNWSGVPLPLDLSILGATNCSLLVSPDLELPTATNGSGNASNPLPLDPNPVLVGVELFTQYAVLDPGVNTLGISASNGTALRVGY